MAPNCKGLCHCIPRGEARVNDLFDFRMEFDKFMTRMVGQETYLACRMG